MGDSLFPASSVNLQTMNAKALNTWKQLTGILMIAVMLILMVNNMAYIHVHVLADGSMVNHAHPFSKKGEPGKGTDHTHSSHSIQFFMNLQVLFLVGLMAFGILIPASRTQRNFSYTPAFIPSLRRERAGRAPPVMDH